MIAVGHSAAIDAPAADAVGQWKCNEQSAHALSLADDTGFAVNPGWRDTGWK